MRKTQFFLFIGKMGHDENNIILYISGDREIIAELYKLISTNTAGYKYYRPENPAYLANFKMYFHELQKLINGPTVASIILNFIITKQFDIDERTQYYLRYWDFEAQMIHTKKSYRSKFECPELTLPRVLNQVLENCEQQGFLPSTGDLFDFLENCAKVKASNPPPTRPALLEFEIIHFVKKQVVVSKSFFEIVQASRILAELHQGNGRFMFFPTLPTPIVKYIANCVRDFSVHDENEAAKIVDEHFVITQEPPHQRP